MSKKQGFYILQEGFVLKTKTKKLKLFLVTIPIGLALAGGIVFFCTHFYTEDDSCQENVVRLQELEASDITQTEKQLQELKKKDKENALSQAQDGINDESALLSDVEIRQAFQGTVILGDSITESIVEYGYLDTDVVISKRGLSVAAADEQIQTAISLHPSCIFMAFGSNDLETYESDYQSFIDAYRNQVKKLQEALPDASIYINGILPLLPSAIEAVPALGYYPDYNEALESFCQEMNCTFIDNSFIVEGNDSIYEPDGEHVIREYYPKWLTYMAQTAGL